MAANTVGQMEPYKPYIERLVIANKITEAQQKVAVQLTVIGPKDYGLLCNLLAPAKLKDNGLEEIVQGSTNNAEPPFKP